MTPGQQRALRELERLHAADPDVFEVVGQPEVVDSWLRVKISLRLGPMETGPGGLDFREREDFILLVPQDFPFSYPSLWVTHQRFAGFPHVNWTRHLCLYQSKVEWNPADGLYGFFDRLRTWLGKAAINDMDPIEGPLHPPVHVTDASLLPFVIQANTPVGAGESWFGLAELKKHSNRFELVGWNDLTRDWPADCHPALTVVLPKALPVEFPGNGKDFFAELTKQGIDKVKVLRYLTIAAKLTPDNDFAFLVLAMPMRRSPDGRLKHHIAVWAIEHENVKRLKDAAPSTNDIEEIKVIKDKMTELIYQIFELTPIKWCPVMEDRSEIVIRRDIGSQIAWFAGKKVLILGCGALGSWAGEIIARANPNLIHLVDNSMVKPGLLARQNYLLEDIGANKAAALATRLRAIVPAASIEHQPREAHSFLTETVERLSGYDVVLDCTASAIFQMKLERDNWELFKRHTPNFISMVIDAKAQRCLAVVLGPNSGGGIWDAYVQLKSRLCLDGSHPDIIQAFYSERAVKDLFQPEPGCSDPTFSGSTADLSGLISTALNLSVSQIIKNNLPAGIAFSAHSQDDRPGALDILKLWPTEETSVGQYRVRISKSVYSEAKAWVNQSNRMRSRKHETGGLLWGLWDDAINVIWILDISGPPPDSLHDPGHFVCGVEGTLDEHRRRFEKSHGTCGFIGFWHTHPGMPPQQSPTDVFGMAGLVSSIGQNQKRAIMLIFGREERQPTANLYIYESQSLTKPAELISVGLGQIILESGVV